MRVFLLTSSPAGTAPHHLQHLLKADVCKVTGVIVSGNVIKNKRKHYLRKAKKIFKIGLLGALNGIRIRKWFTRELYVKMGTTDIESICRSHAIPILYTPTINCDHTIAMITTLKSDLGISIGNGYIGKRIFSLPPLGMINIHHESLPEYQNAQSVIWQIYNNSASSGYTIHKIDSHIDSGDILYKETVPIEFKETLSATIANSYFLLVEASARGLVYVIRNFQAVNSSAIKQSGGRKFTTPTFWQFLRICRNFRNLRKLFLEKAASG